MNLNEVRKEADANLQRYARQTCFEQLGQDGQQRLLAGRALVCGCGALGSVIAEILVRAGVGLVRIVDRDFLELNNLQRQVLYTEEDVAAGLPKAIAAARHLRQINSEIEIESIVADVTHINIASLADNVDVIVDGTDNFETRLLVNDYAIKHTIPWVYGGCIGAEGQTMAILPGETPCLSCLIADAPPPGTMPTCDTAGILGSTVHVVAALQAVEAIKILSDNLPAVSRFLTVVDLWDGRMRQLDMANLREKGDCRTCQHREFPWLTGEKGSAAAVLCGRNAVQLAPSGGALSLDTLAATLAGVGTVKHNGFLLRLSVDQYEVTVFPDGRTIIAGTDDVATARTIQAKYLGS